MPSSQRTSLRTCLAQTPARLINFFRIFRVKICFCLTTSQMVKPKDEVEDLFGSDTGASDGEEAEEGADKAKKGRKRRADGDAPPRIRAKKPAKDAWEGVQLAYTV